MTLSLIVSWFKTNAVKILLVSLFIFVILLIACAWWLKIRGFKITDLLLRLQMANAKNEINHLQTKKAVLETKKDTTKEVIVDIEKEIKEEQKKIIEGRMKIEGLNDEEIVDRFTKLGF